MIFIRLKDDMHVPVIMCDGCGHEITDATDGNFEWHMHRDNVPSGVFFTHKRCSDALRANSDALHAKVAPESAEKWLWACEELVLFPWCLAASLGMPPITFTTTTTGTTDTAGTTWRSRP